MRRMFCTSGRLYTLGHSGWIFLLRTLGTTMFFSCSETNVLAVCGKDNEGKVSCHFLDLGHDLASPKRQSTIQLAIEDNTVAINGEWRDMFLCLWTNKRVCSRFLEGGIKTIAWTTASAGCLALLVLQSDGHLVTLTQTTSRSSFSFNSYKTSINAANYDLVRMLPAPPSSAKGLIVMLVPEDGSNGIQLCEMEINLVLGQVVEKNRQTINLEHTMAINDIILYRNELFLVGTDKAIVSINMNTLAIQTRRRLCDSDSVLLNKTMGLFIHNHEIYDLLNDKTLVLSDEYLISKLYGFSDQPQSCLSSNATLMLRVSSEGFVSASPLVMDSHELLSRLVDAWSLGRSVADMSRCLRGIRPLKDSPTIDHLSSLNLRKSHMAGLFIFLLDIDLLNGRDEDAFDGLWVFFQKYLRIGHFWEVVVTCTVDMSRTMKSLESLQVPSSEAIKFNPLLIDSLVDLTSEFITVVGNLFLSETDLAVRAIKIVVIHHRITSSLILLECLLQNILALVDHYRQGNIQPLQDHFSLLHDRLRAHVDSHFDLSKLIQTLQSVKPDNHSFASIFDRPGPDSDALSSGLASVIRTLIKTDNIRGNKVDSVSGLPSAFDYLCPTCLQPRRLSSDGQSQRPFWYSNWDYVCICGTSLVR